MEQLEELEAHLHAQGAPVVNHLNAGLSPQAMATLIEPLELRLPGEALTWWSWHDGAAAQPSDSPPATALGPFGRAEPLHVAIEHRRMRLRIARDVEPGRPALIWPATLLPLLEAGDVAIDCASPRNGPVPVWRTNPHLIDIPEVAARSIGELVAWWLEGFRLGAYRWSARRHEWLVDEQFRVAHRGCPVARRTL